MKKIFSLTFAAALIFGVVFPSLSQTRGRREIRARVEAEVREQRRDRIQEELQNATEELVTLTESLVREVEIADGYTTSMEILESSDRIEALAVEIGELARTINRRAQGR